MALDTRTRAHLIGMLLVTVAIATPVCLLAVQTLVTSIYVSVVLYALITSVATCVTPYLIYRIAYPRVNKS